MNRQEENRKILKKLSEIVENFTDWRFQQILWNLGIISRDENMNIVDRYYEESAETFKIVDGNVEYILKGNNE